MNTTSTPKPHRQMTQALFLLFSLIASLWALPAAATQLDLADIPLYLTASAKPIAMLNISKDHQLYFKAYDDYSDLDDDGILDTTYDNDIDYYGYFDSYKCYNYNTTTQRFEPNALTTTKYCSGNWSGNFLNWASMSRIDTIRKILYGGKRYTDTGVQPSLTTVTSQPVSSDPVATGPSSTATAYTLAQTVLFSDVITSTENGSNTSCSSLPITGAESSPSAESGHSATEQGPTTDTTPVPTTTTTTTPVVTTTDSPSGPITTTSYDTAVTSTFNRTTSTQYTTTYTTTYNKTVYRSNATTTSCRTTIEHHTKTYIRTYRSTQVTPYQKITTTTTTTTNTPIPGLTVLERAYLPNDAHSFAKFYKGSDLSQLTPFNESTGITLCNTTVSTTTLSQNVTDAPLIRVAKGNYSLWAANERWQCRWSEEKSASNRASTTADPGIGAERSNPTKSSVGLGSKDYVARVEVCNIDLIGSEKCKIYPDKTRKPIGLLQTYGDEEKIRFGLLTGTYGKNKSGGVLRKNASSMSDEINVDTNGTFKTAPSTGAIINTLNKFRIYGYRHDDGTFFGTTGSDNCTWGLNTYSDGNCSNWGNPQSEIFLESLRYLANKSATSTFSSTDSSYISGLTSATFSNPLISTEYCAALNIIQFNASSSSYDADQLGGLSDLTSTAIGTLTNTVGDGEGITGNSYFIGENGTDNNQLCTAKTVSALSTVRGTCPDAPRLSGSYQIAGLAHFAHTNDIQSSLTGTQKVTTYGVALAPAVPKVEIPVPNTSKKVTILPACRNSDVGGNCAIVDFKIIHQDCSLLSASEKLTGTQNCGKLYVNWEDSEQGGDFDQDVWGVLTYSVNSTQVKVTTDVIEESTIYKMGFGYVIGGTTKDGFHAHSGIEGYNYTDPQSVTGCANCAPADAATTVTYAIGSSSASTLQQPLFYAAKWGGFDDYDKDGKPSTAIEWDTNSNGVRDGVPNRYFYATNPKKLETSLAAALYDVVQRTSSSSAAAANSTSLQTGTVLYQAQFSSNDWSGHLYSFPITSDGTIANVNGDLTDTDPPLPIYNCVDANWCAETLIPSPSDRNIKTINGTSGVDFLWDASHDNLSAAQKLALRTGADGVVGNETLGQARLNWLRGDTSNSNFRVRPDTPNKNGDPVVNRLGDIINSDPLYVHTEDFGFASLGTDTTAPERSSYAAYVATKSSRPPMVYDGANDGMLHGFRADTNNTNSGKELLAYIPNAVFSNLSSLTDPHYQHKYFVEGSPNFSDAYLSPTNGTPAWKTVLVGGLNKGGKAIYALDVSNPTAFANTHVLWEYSGSTDPDTSEDGTGVTDADGMGLTFSQPQIARLNNGVWAVIFGNGYNSTSEQAFLYIVNLSTGALIKKIATNTDVSNGLSTPKLYDNNGDKIIDYVYAGDLRGNMWKFDLSSGSSSSWGLGNGGNPLFTARNTDNQIQPITVQPALSRQTSGLLVLFGTGQYLTNSDVTNTQVQSFYGIFDKSTSSTVIRSNLVQQSVEDSNQTYTNPDCTDTVAISGNECQLDYVLRTSTTHAVDPLTKDGWYMDFSPPHVSEGERIISGALVKYDRVIFLTAIPSFDPCTPGGTSWLMELDLKTGGATAVSSFDFNNDDKFDAKDLLANGKRASGVKLKVGMVKSAVWLDKEGTGTAVKEMSGTSSSIMTLKNKGGEVTSGKVQKTYWLQIQ